MASSGYSGTPLAKKLGIKQGFKIRLINPPDYYYKLFSDLPPDIIELPDNTSRKDFIHYFAVNVAQLEKDIRLLRQEIEENGMIWVSWYKKSAKMETDVNENSIREMATDKLKVTIHMVSSLDGFIAKKDNSVSWFETSGNYENGVDGEDPEEFLKTIDCYVMGSKTYELAEELSKNYGWPYGDKPTIVLTNHDLQTDRKNVEFYSGDLNKFINEHLKPRFENVWVVGGSNITRDFIRLKLADEIRVSLLPIILGDGLPFFDHIEQEQTLHLKDIKAYKNGMVELHYNVEN